MTDARRRASAWATEEQLVIGEAAVRSETRAGAAPRIAVAVESRYLAQAQPAGTIAALRRLGHGVEVVDPAAPVRPAGWPGAFDLVLARGRSAALLALLAEAEAAGVPTVNRSGAIAAVLDKGAMARALLCAGIPSPETRVGTLAELAVGARYPIVVKPVLGDNARGVRIARSAEELLAGDAAERLLAQPFVDGERVDTKLYVAGGEVWAVKKASPMHDPGSAAAERIPLAPGFRELGLRCARLFGLELAGVDCVLTGRGLVVIEVNDFPNYSGVPEASEAVARVALARARRTAGAQP